MVAAVVIALVHPVVAIVAAVAGLAALGASPQAARIVLLLAAATAGVVAAYLFLSVGD